MSLEKVGAFDPPLVLIAPPASKCKSAPPPPPAADGRFEKLGADVAISLGRGIRLGKYGLLRNTARGSPETRGLFGLLEPGLTMSACPT